MLSRAKTSNGALAYCSNLFRLFKVAPFSSKPLYRTRPSQTTTKDVRSSSKSSMISSYKVNTTTPSSDVESICSILSKNNTEKSNLDEVMTDFKKKIDSELVMRVLMNYKHLGRIKTLEFFSWSGVLMDFKFEDYVVEFMADFLCRRKLFDDLKCLLIAVSSSKGRVSCRAISIGIRFLGREGRVEEALCLFKEMECKFNCKPDNLVFNNMLYVLCKKENSGHFLDFAIMIFRRIETPDTFSYSNVLVGLCKFGRLETAVELFHEMCRAGLVPTRTALNVLVGELCSLSSKEGAIEKVRCTEVRRAFTILVPNVSAATRSGAIEPAVEVFFAVHKMGVLPSTFVIKKLLLEVCRIGRTDEAIGVLKIIVEKKLACMEECLIVVVKALCEHRSVDKVGWLFQEMLSWGLKPKITVYNSIIGMLCKLGRLDDAERIFKFMNENRCVPDAITYTMLIHAYGGVPNWEASYSLLIEMMRLNICPHFHTYTLVEKLLRENKETCLSEKLQERMEMQLLRKQCKEGQLDASIEKLKSMIEKGIYPPVYIRDAFRDAFEKSDKWELARQLLETMDKDIRIPEGRRLENSQQF